MKTKMLIQCLLLIGVSAVVVPAQAHPDRHDHWPIYGLIGLTLLDQNFSRHHRHEHRHDGWRRYRNESPRQYSYGYQRKDRHHGRRGHKHDRRRR